MTAMELYEALMDAGIAFEVHEISEGERFLVFKVEEKELPQ
jgi:hypothetical protein